MGSQQGYDAMVQMNIASCLNEYYVPYTYMMLKSLFASNRQHDITVYLLHDGLSGKSKNNLTKLAERYSEASFKVMSTVDAEDGTETIGQKHIEYIRVTDYSLDPKIHEYGGWNELTMYRLLLWEILPADVGRVLHLDGDMIVHKDLSPLYEMDFEGNDLIACKDILAATLRKDFCIETHGEEFRDLFEEGRYFNAGMILMNVAKNRGCGRLSIYEETARKLNYVVPYPDQDLLNYIHQDAVKYVNTFAYNFPAYDGENLDGGFPYGRADREVAIFHYLDKKPWIEGDHEIYDLEKFFWDEVEGTPYEKTLKKELLVVILDLEKNENSILQTSKSIKKVIPKYFRHFRIITEDGEDGYYPSIGALKNKVVLTEEYDYVMFIKAGDELGNIMPIDFGKDYDGLREVLLLEGSDVVSRLICTPDTFAEAGGFSDLMCEDEYEFALRAIDCKAEGLLIWVDNAFERLIYEETFDLYIYLLDRYRNFLDERGLYDKAFGRIWDEAESVGAKKMLQEKAEGFSREESPIFPILMRYETAGFLA